jgi:uncharacterized small protein (DUF1192 family)
MATAPSAIRCGGEAKTTILAEMRAKIAALEAEVARLSAKPEAKPKKGSA